MIVFAWVWVKDKDWDRIRNMLRVDSGVIDVEYREEQEDAN